MAFFRAPGLSPHGEPVRPVRNGQAAHNPSPVTDPGSYGIRSQYMKQEHGSSKAPEGESRPWQPSDRQETNEQRSLRFRQAIVLGRQQRDNKNIHSRQQQ